MVVAAIGTLVETANSACNGNATEERIIASAKGVASSTAQLLLASRVKADLNSLPQRNLQVNCFSLKLRYKLRFRIYFLILHVNLNDILYTRDKH